MPYVPKERRQQLLVMSLDQLLSEARAERLSEGDLNYIFCSLLWRTWDSKPSYKQAHSLKTLLTEVGQEFHDKKVRPYEDKKLRQNGDLTDGAKPEDSLND